MNRDEEKQSSLWDVLPEDVIRLILSALPNTKEAATKTLISKSWYRAWTSSPFFVFIDTWNSDKQQQQLFYQFIDKTMSRIQKDKIRVQRFVLDLNKRDHRFDKWINTALDNKIQDISLSVHHEYNPVVFPNEQLVNNTFLKSLNLYGMCMDESESLSINMPSLRSLTLSDFDISNRTLEKFLKGCPLIETLAIKEEGHKLSRIDLTGSGFNHLKAVNLEFLGRHSIDITVDAPNLEIFRCHTTGRRGGQRSVLDIDNCLKLKHLDLKPYTLDGEWLYELIGKLTCLEALRLCFNEVIKCIKISSRCIKTIELRSYGKVRSGMTIDAPRLSSFRCSGCCFSDKKKSEYLINPSHACRAHLSFRMYGSQLKYWSSKLRGIVGSFRDVRSLSLFYHPEDKDKINCEEDELPSSTIEIEHLYFEICGWSNWFNEHEKILSSLLSIFHPKMVTVGVPAIKKSLANEVLKLLRKMLENNGWGEDEYCRCCDEFKCWKHQLKEVVEVDEDESYRKEWSELDSIYRVEPKICFKLKWL